MLMLERFLKWEYSLDYETKAFLWLMYSPFRPMEPKSTYMPLSLHEKEHKL